MSISKLYGKIIIEANLEVLTGMHISSSSDFAAIGAVDTVVVRDPITHQPIIPGSSVKGKLRYLLSRVTTEREEISKLMDESDELKRLFGTSMGDLNSRLSRLQFYDLKLNPENKEKLSKLDLDLPFTEIKFENTINRATGVANPRQIERVIAGSIFDFKLVYNVENIDDLGKDFDLIKLGIEVLENDYIGGHGTRGYGKVKFDNYNISIKNYSDNNIDISEIKSKFE